MLNADDIDAAISARAAEIERLRHDLEIAEAELRGMKSLRDRIFKVTAHTSVAHSALRVAPSPVVSRAAVDQRAASAPIIESGVPIPPIKRYRGGRQPGAISNTWKRILSDAWHEFGDAGFKEIELAELVSKHGIILKQSDVRNRMLGYATHDYVEENPDETGTWRVTESAAKKFDFFDKPLDKPSNAGEAK